MKANAPLTSLNLTNLSTNTTQPEKKITPLVCLGTFHVLLLDHYKSLENNSLPLPEVKNTLQRLKESSAAIEEYLKSGPLAEINDPQEVDYGKEINIYDRTNNLKKAKWVFTEYKEIIRKAEENYAKYAENQPINTGILPTNIKERTIVLQRLASSIDYHSQLDMSICNSTTTFTFAALIMAISAIAMYCLFMSSKDR